MTTGDIPKDRKMVALTIQCAEQGLLLEKHVIILVLWFFRFPLFFFCIEKMTHCLQAENNDKHNSVNSLGCQTFWFSHGCFLLLPIVGSTSLSFVYFSLLKKLLKIPIYYCSGGKLSDMLKSKVQTRFLSSGNYWVDTNIRTL